MTIHQYIQTIVLFLFLSSSVLGQDMSDQFFRDTDIFMQKYVESGSIDYNTLYGNMDILPLINKIENIDASKMTESTKKAFYINAYNLHVINLVLTEYPLQSVQDIPGFFDKKKIKIAGITTTLNSFEKKHLLKTFDDPRLHFVLVCGAVDCPPITNFAYTPALIEEQLEGQTRNAINDPDFIKENGDQTQISQIFKWYKTDFGGSKKDVMDYINNYRENPINEKTNYYAYDWTLNDTKLNLPSGTSNGLGNNASRYVVSSTIPIGSYEIKIFNNLYSQKTRSDGEFTNRSSFFTTTLTALYGLSNRLNVGINARVRKVRNHGIPSSPFSVFGTDEIGSSRSGLTALGPMIRWAAVPQWENFSIQSSYTFAIGENLTGGIEGPYIDWDGAVWNTQFFNDFPIGDYFSLFTEIDFLWEDIGGSTSDVKRTPITAILSYNPTPKSTLYALSGYAPTWSLENENGESGLTVSDYFYQLGFGAKYQFTPNFEIELLYTDFSNKGLSDNDGQAATYNFGLRFNL